MGSSINFQYPEIQEGFSLAQLANNLSLVEQDKQLVIWILIILVCIIIWIYRNSPRNNEQLNIVPEVNNESENLYQTYEAETQAQPEVGQPIQANKEKPNSKTSLGKELYHKLLGIFFISIAAIGRYALSFHVTDVRFSTNIRYQIFMGLIVIAVWIYGATREDKRDMDGWVIGILILWSLLLFL